MYFLYIHLWRDSTENLRQKNGSDWERTYEYCTAHRTIQIDIFYLDVPPGHNGLLHSSECYSTKHD